MRSQANGRRSKPMHPFARLARFAAVVSSTLAIAMLMDVTVSTYAASGPTDELRVAYGAIGSTRHPHGTQILPDDDINNTIFDPLLTLKPDGSVEPVLATKFEQVSETRLRFYLRPGVRFHDGSPLTSADVKFSVENYLKPESTLASHKRWLDRVEIVDDLTVDIVAKAPFRPALAVLGYVSHIIPQTARDWKAFAQRPIGTGPYRFIEFVPNDRVIVEANMDYWGPKKPSFRRIVFRQIPENSTRVAALETGEVDFATNIPLDSVGRLKSAGFQIASVPSNRLMFVRFNMAVDGPWKDVRVRQALNYAVDKEAIRKAFLGGLGAVAEAPVTHSTVFFNGSLPKYGYDPAKARQLLTAAGYPNGFEASFATPNGRYLKDREIAEAIVGQLEAVGVRVTLVPLEWATYLQQLRTEKDTTGRRYPLSLMAWGNVTGDPDFGLRPLDDDPWNLGGYVNREVQTLLKEGVSTFDKARLRTIYDRTQVLIWRDAPWVFLFDLPIVDAMSPKLKGHVPRPDEQIRWNLITREN